MRGAHGRRGLIALSVLAAALLTAPPARGATLSTTTLADEFGHGSGCSLREAVESTNRNEDFGGCRGHSGPYDHDQIYLAGGVHRLTIPPGDEAALPIAGVNAAGDLDVTDTYRLLILPRPGARAVVASRVADRVLQVATNFASVTLQGITVRGGQPPSFPGGGILSSGDLILFAAALVGNEAPGGAGGGLP